MAETKEECVRRNPAMAIAGVVVAVCLVSMAEGRDAARDLKKMVGFTILDASWISDVTQNRMGGKYVELGNGSVFKVDFLLLDPLPITDVIVFAKAPSKEITESFVGKLPEYMMYQYKLLIDNEAYDATVVR
jgi:hypothetical protein